MAYLYWLTPLAVSLLFVATVTALASRCHTRFWRLFWPVMSAVIIFFGFAFVVGIGIFLLKENIQPKFLFWYGLFQTIGYIIGAIILLKRGLSGENLETQTARSWPRSRLALAFALVFIIHIVVFDLMQLQSMVNLANVRIEATCNLINFLPARLPDDLNARPVYEKAAKMLFPEQDPPRWFLDSKQAGFDPANESAVRFLDQHPDVLPLIRKAASLPGYSLEVEKSYFFEWPIPEFSQYRNLAIFISLDARNKALSGDIAGALRDLAAIEAMARHLRSYPMTISLAMAGAVDEIRIRSLEYILAHLSVSMTNLINISIPRTSPASVLNTFLKVLRVESQGQLQGFTVLSATSDIQTTFNTSQIVLNNVTILTKMWRIFFLPSELRAARDIITEGLSKPAKTYKDAQANIDAIEDAQQSGRLGIFTSIVSPSYSRYLQTAMRQDVLNGLGDLALAAAAYKIVKGKYPSKGEDLVPDFINRVPMDPYDGQTLKLKCVNGGMDLYSAAPHPNLSYNDNGAIHFYLGKVPYEEYRVKPEMERKTVKKKKK